MSTIAPIPMRRVASYGELSELGAPGTFTYGSGRDGADRYLIFVCDRAECIHSVPIQGHPKSWAWDGNEEQPSVSPSIRDLGHCRWHGFITKGELVTCSDAHEGSTTS